MQPISHLLLPPSSPDPLLDQIRRSPGAAVVLAYLRRTVPDVKTIPPLTYSVYREFERSGQRDSYQRPYFLKRSQLSRAALEMILGDDSMRDAVSDLLWSICEETSWVLPAHEEQGPDFWELKPSPRQRPWGAHTALTREPDAIDLFCAETGAAVAEVVYLLGDRLPAEVCQRARQEVERHIFKPYLAYGRKHWWYRGALNWNGVCNGSIGMAFMRLERDPRTLGEAMEQVLEGLEAYIATGFEPDGGSIEGPGYWNYGLMYYVTLAELLRERTGGDLDLLSAPRMADIARYPLGMALSPDRCINFGDAVEQTAYEPGIIQRLSERTGVSALRRLILPADRLEGFGVASAKTTIMLRDAAWWDGQTHPFPAEARQDFYLPECGVVKFAGQVGAGGDGGGKPVILAAKAGHNDGHHSHADIGQLIYHVDGESLLCDPGRGLYSREYFRETRYENIFCNSFGHSVPVIGGKLQSPGPEFGGQKHFSGTIEQVSGVGVEKCVTIEFHKAYDLPALVAARRTLRFNSQTGALTLEDSFGFDTELSENGEPIEECLVTWAPVTVEGSRARICGERTTLDLSIRVPEGVSFQVERLEEACQVNRRDGVLSRITARFPRGQTHFVLQIVPHLA